MFQQRIREHYESLTPGYRKLADFIMQNTLEAAFLTITELAQRIDLDPATIVRFCQEIGYTGYREFSKEIKAYVRELTARMHKPAKADQHIEEQIHRIEENTLQNLQQLFAAESEHITEAARIMRAAPSIWLTGDLAGHFIAETLAKEMIAFSKPVHTFRLGITDIASTLLQMQKGDALLVLSPTHHSIDAGYVIKMARQKGLTTICITGAGTRLPARSADLVIKTQVQKQPISRSLTATMVTINLIWELILIQQAEEFADITTEIYDNIAQLRDLWAKTEPREAWPPQLTEDT